MEFNQVLPLYFIAEVTNPVRQLQSTTEMYGALLHGTPIGDYFTLLSSNVLARIFTPWFFIMRPIGCPLFLVYAISRLYREWHTPEVRQIPKLVLCSWLGGTLLVLYGSVVFLLDHPEDIAWPDFASLPPLPAY